MTEKELETTEKKPVAKKKAAPAKKRAAPKKRASGRSKAAKRPCASVMKATTLAKHFLARKRVKPECMAAWQAHGRWLAKKEGVRFGRL